MATNFKTELPKKIKYISTKFRQERGLLPCRFWTARIKNNETYYDSFLNEMETYNLKKTVKVDELTGFKIISYKSNFMSGINYEVDFFDDNVTIRVYIIDCP